MNSKMEMHDSFGIHARRDITERNEVAEKFNEVMGRQMKAELDPLVEIRSSVHSNYAGMVAMLGADNRVYLGREEYLIDNFGEKPSFYSDRDGSLCFVSDMPDMYYFLYGEGWHHTQEDMLERGLTMEQYLELARIQAGVLAQFEQVHQIQFAGQPFKAPANHLQNAELDMEVEGGNYNMVGDCVINNQPPARADLTDGQTYDEIAELAPETLQEEKPSVLEQLRIGQKEHRKTQDYPDSERVV